MNGDKKIETMQKAGKILGEVIDILLDSIKPGITELEIDQLAERLIRERGGKSGFKLVPGYKHTICISVNEVVVHGIPTKRVIQEGDIVGIDCGVYLDGYHTDMAESMLVSGSKKGSKEERIEKFLKTGKKAMFAGISQAKAGNHVGHISQAIQEIVEGGGYSIVKNLVGHGVGRELHEEPEIPGYVEGKVEKTPTLKEGMTIAVEVIYNMGTSGVVYNGEDDWTIVTEDGSLSGLSERTIVVGQEKAELITKRQSDVTYQ